MPDIKLNFINKSNDQNNSEILIFQKNVTTGASEIAVAWQVLKNLGQNWHHVVNYPSAVSVAAADEEGNASDLHAAENGQTWSVIQTSSGHQVKYNGPAESPQCVEINNDLPQGAIEAQIYKDGKLLAVTQGVHPGQKAVFEFKPTIWVGVASEVSEGDVIDSAIISDINTEISLLGIASADIVMTGGGSGQSATPFTFTLQNVVMA